MNAYECVCTATERGPVEYAGFAPSVFDFLAMAGLGVLVEENRDQFDMTVIRRCNKGDFHYAFANGKFVYHYDLTLFLKEVDNALKV